MIYLISPNKYKSYFKTGLYKYIPDFLLPKYRPMVLDNIVKGEEVVGRIIGINLKNVDLSVESSLDEYVQNILKLKLESDQFLYIEDDQGFDVGILEEIEIGTQMTIPTGESLWIYNVPLIIDQLLKSLNEDALKEEVLIICGDKAQTIELINSLSENLRFISIIGIDEQVLEEIYEEILESSGISIFLPMNIEKVIKNYGIIINLSEKLFISLKHIRRKAIIFDISKSNEFGYQGNHCKNSIIIEGINMSIAKKGICKGSWFEDVISPGLYESLNMELDVEFYQIYSKNKYYFIEDFINREIKIKGRI